jgi:hypothetical protein
MKVLTCGVLIFCNGIRTMVVIKHVTSDYT